MSDRPKLDPVDGQPTFAELDGVWISRVRWLEATRADRKDALVADLHAAAAAGDEDPPKVSRASRPPPSKPSG